MSLTLTSFVLQKLSSRYRWRSLELWRGTGFAENNQFLWRSNIVTSQAISLFLFFWVEVTWWFKDGCAAGLWRHFQLFVFLDFDGIFFFCVLWCGTSCAFHAGIGLHSDFVGTMSEMSALLGNAHTLAGETRDEDILCKHQGSEKRRQVCTWSSHPGLCIAKHLLPDLHIPLQISETVKKT